MFFPHRDKGNDWLLLCALSPHNGVIGCRVRMEESVFHKSFKNMEKIE